MRPYSNERSGASVKTARENGGETLKMADLSGGTVVLLHQVCTVFSPGLQQQTDGSSESTGCHVPLFVGVL